MYRPETGGTALKLIMALVDDLAERDPDMLGRLEAKLRWAAKNASMADEADLFAAAQLLSDKE